MHICINEHIYAYMRTAKENITANGTLDGFITDVEGNLDYFLRCVVVSRELCVGEDGVLDVARKDREEVFVVGRMARPDLDKWSSNTWPIYSAIQYANKRAFMLGIDERLHQKLGPSPIFADCLKPNAIDVRQYLGNLHCLLPVNGGARENWPRAGLEALATGVPIVAQNLWGWREMIDHGETGCTTPDAYTELHGMN